MLRWTVLALLIANIAYAAWAAGWLSIVGLAPATQRDPQRVAQQQRPDLMRVVPPGSARAPTAAPAATAAAEAAASAPDTAASAALAAAAPNLCFESAPLPAAQLEPAERALAGVLPAGAWARANRIVPAQHGVVIGPLTNRDAVQKKSDEINRLRLPHETVTLPGDRNDRHLALGRYDALADAQAALLAFGQRGVRTARVALLREAGTETRLRVEVATPEQAAALRALKSPALGEAGMSSCSTG